MLNIEQKMKNMKVKGKLNMYRSFAIAIVVVLGLVSAVLSMIIRANVKEITDSWSPSLYYVQRMNTLTSDYRMKQYGHLVAETDVDMERYDEELIALNEQIEEASAKFSELIATEHERELYENILTKWELYKEQSIEIIDLSRKGQTEKAGTLMLGEAYVTYQDFCTSYEELLTFEQKELNIAKRTVSITFILIFVVIVVVVAVAVVMATKLGRIVIKLITEPVEQITRASELMHDGDMSAAKLITYEAEDELGVVAQSLRGTMDNLDNYVEEISTNLKEIAKGDLTKDSDEITNFLGDFESIKESFVYILKKFNSTLSEIQNTSAMVATSSGEIAKSSKVLAEGATDQASAIEELTATIATVAGLADESAKSTQEAYDNIRVSADNAEQEKQKMEDLKEEMNRITEISKEIENIITAIEDIASQTNLLSLNASIEAARAGEAGKGFAVVADQIGKLATDSAQSAVNTRELIIKTLIEIEKGNEITASTSVAFEKMIDEMRMFAGAAQVANENAKNQASALEQVEQGIDQIAAVMQTTASAAEESTAVSEELSKEAKVLDELVTRFKLY